MACFKCLTSCEYKKQISLKKEAYLFSLNKPCWKSEPIVRFWKHSFPFCFGMWCPNSLHPQHVTSTMYASTGSCPAIKDIMLESFTYSPLSKHLNPWHSSFHSQIRMCAHVHTAWITLDPLFLTSHHSSFKVQNSPSKQTLSNVYYNSSYVPCTQPRCV